MIDWKLVALKGLIEHNEPGVYWGSTMILGRTLEQMVEVGWLEPIEQVLPGCKGPQPWHRVTDAGMEVYRKLALNELPWEGRAEHWRLRPGCREASDRLEVDR